MTRRRAPTGVAMLERRVAHLLGRGPFGRIGLAAALHALTTLVRRHPQAVIDALTAGAGAAGREGWAEVEGRLRPKARERRPTRPSVKGLSAAERRRLREYLHRAARRDAGDGGDVASR